MIGTYGMLHLTDEDLEELMRDLESFRVERKTSWSPSAATKGQEDVCAFANDLPDAGLPGILFVGVRDDGTPSGLDVTDQLLQQLAAVKYDGNILPPPSLTVEKRRLAGHDVAVVAVAPSSSPPVRYRGRIWIRTASRRGLATAQDEQILVEKRRHGDRPFDARPVHDASLQDLNLRYFDEDYLPSAFDREVLAANERTTSQRLAATKMVESAEEPTPTTLGLLVLSARSRHFLPGAYVQFLRIGGCELSDPVVDELMIEGMIADVVRRTEDKFVSHNRVAVDFTSGPLETRKYQYPLDAIQQLFRNAVLHRDYEFSNAPVRLNWFDDRIEIINPGGPFGAVGIDSFGQPGLTDYRNPGLADALRVLKFIQRFGAGIDIARRALAGNGNPPPEFDVHTTHVNVKVKPRTD